MNIIVLPRGYQVSLYRVLGKPHIRGVHHIPYLIPYPISYPRWMPSPLTLNTGQAPSSGCSSYPGSSATASSASQSQRKGTYMRKDPKFVFICGNYQTRNN